MLALPVSAGQPADTAMMASLAELQHRAVAGVPDAIYRLAILYESGYTPAGIQRDSLRAMNLYAAAAEAGHPAAQNYYGYMLFNNGEATRGLELIERAARAGEPKACYNLGSLLESGDHVERDYTKAAYWYNRAATAGLPLAMAALAGMNCTGQGMEPDTTKAVALYDAAITAGYTEAQRPLTIMMYRKWKRLSPSDALSLGLYYHSLRAYDAAVLLWNNVAEAPVADGDTIARQTRARARALIGEAYSRGLGVEYSHAASLEYYFLAAVDGNPSAQFVLAELLSIFPDALTELISPEALAAVNARTSSASYWYERAAQAGITTAEAAARALFP